MKIKNINKKYYICAIILVVGFGLCMYLLFSDCDKFSAPTPSSIPPSPKATSIQSPKETSTPEKTVDENKKIVYIIFSPKCRYCIDSKKDFEKAQHIAPDYIKLIDATDSKNKKLLDSFRNKKYKINGYPTIINEDGIVYTERLRTYRKILKFAGIHDHP